MANFTKFFRNGKTFSAYCRMRYGASKMIWDATDLWEKSGVYSIAFDEAAADERFGCRQNGLSARSNLAIVKLPSMRKTMRNAAWKRWLPMFTRELV